MSSYLEKECSGPPQPDPGWVAVLLAYDADQCCTQVRFDDVSLEWHRGSHNPRLFGRTRIIGNKMMPLGYMLRKCWFGLADAFLEKFENVHDTCAWYNCGAWPPLQYIARVQNTWNINVWFPLLWNNGMSVDEIEPETFKCDLTASWLSLYKERESAMLALAWTCDQIAGMSWADCAEPVVKRMRRTKEN
jgi:hypothetical protein